MSVDYDLVLEAVGECGPWQIGMFVLLALPSCLSGMAVYMYQYTAFIPKHRCFVPYCDDENSEYIEDHLTYSVPKSDDRPSQCQEFERNDQLCDRDSFNSNITECSKWVWSSSFVQSSATIDLQMVCSNAWKHSTAQTMYMLGMVLGSLVFGWTSDSYGRKGTLVFSSVILGLGGSVQAMVLLTPPMYYILFISRFLSGLGHAGAFMVTFALALEYVGPKYRVLFGIIIETPFATGGLLVGLISYLGVREWTTLALVLSLPNLVVVFYWWFIPESPRWLIARGNIDQLQKDIAKVARINGTTMPNLGDCQTQRDETSTRGVDNNASFGKATVKDLLRPTTILVRSLVMSFNWFVVNMCFYGLTSTVTAIMDATYLTQALVILVEIPSHFFAAFMLSRLGRRRLLGACQILAGTTCMAAAALNQPEHRFLQWSLALVGKFGASCSFAIVFVYTAELFPTEIRSLAVGTASTCARLGGVLAPQIAGLVYLWTPLPLLILGGGSAIGGILVFLFLPETLGEKLPETMEDAIALGSSKRLDRGGCCYSFRLGK